VRATVDQEEVGSKQPAEGPPGSACWCDVVADDVPHWNYMPGSIDGDDVPHWTYMPGSCRDCSEGTSIAEHSASCDKEADPTRTDVIFRFEGDHTAWFDSLRYRPPAPGELWLGCEPHNACHRAGQCQDEPSATDFASSPEPPSSCQVTDCFWCGGRTFEAGESLVCKDCSWTVIKAVYQS
jgi:hypothetical protein